MPYDLTDRLALVTGATSGIGAACVDALVGAGARVVAAARRADRLDALASRHPGRVHPLVLDVRDRAAVEASLATLPAAWSAVEVLVNNAGLALGLEPAQRASVDEWQTMIDTNCTGLVVVTRALLPGMVERGRGHVVNVASVAGTYPYPGGNVYGATKAFVRQFTLNLKADLIGTGVRATSVEPGMVETEFSLVRFSGDAGKAKQVYHGMQPLGPEDVADAILWCVSRPPHVNVNALELMPERQAFSPFAVKRG
ncbi:SDR family NAD(P)-dependent oxidoreductase [Anaeromyxobacter dehalogenans]|uniref:Short-chain dehydrogenase/reductase SDR n=1 Tax=Anaeromyxobacter dehalogenans (strain 2CP-C) TaxID=290397 RepID=Q2IPW0_ANADE|nr:SDR family NAD(P)-dependent oxidoreductase [Anaeromyxobacter dehalogenans]ABC80845.1 short-chain dehydrogenase/reductase SDR [Anaeromyxobacter dehalogenans 2CP-C]